MTKFMQEMEATGLLDTGMDTFKALKMASGLPFKAGAHKVIILLTSSEKVKKKIARSTS